uniref:rRNA methyltransferase 1, mitochondrial n=1 Tax=Trichobilharzia regenti TaxID=157069 RepID=A0AA85KG88_TRIRE|nr:unnamed protein product [Trichobilharzia regenti]
MGSSSLGVVAQNKIKNILSFLVPTFFHKPRYNLTTSCGTIHQQLCETLYGIHPVLCALSFHQRNIKQLYVRDISSKTKDSESLVELSLSQIIEEALRFNIPITHVSVEELKVLSNSRSHQGVLLEVSPIIIHPISNLSIQNLLHSWTNPSEKYFPFVKKNNRPIILLLDHISDVMNFGSILRSAAFFGVSAVLLSTAPCVTPSPLISKLSVGAMEGMLFYRLTDIVMDMKSLSDAGFLVVGTCGESQISPNAISKPLNCLQPNEVGVNDCNNNTRISPRPMVLALGSESRGLSENVLNACDLLLRVPGLADTPNLVNKSISQNIPSSLNVAVAAGILLYQLTMYRHGCEAANTSSFVFHKE